VFVDSHGRRFRQGKLRKLGTPVNCSRPQPDSPLSSSLQALAVAGLSVVGRDLYGVYPLRGKPLNARDAPVKQISGNKELQDLVAALGLDFTKTYETVRATSNGLEFVAA